MNVAPEQYQQLLADIRRIVREEIAQSSAAPAPAEAQPENEMLSAQQVGWALNMSLDRVRRLIKNGAIPSVRYGSRKYVLRGTLKDLPQL